jgi:hypothetical protein
MNRRLAVRGTEKERPKAVQRRNECARRGEGEGERERERERERG